MHSEIKRAIREALIKLNIDTIDIAIEHPADLALGDYSTNIALVLAKQEKINPKDLAEKILSEISKNLPTAVERITVAGPGFINFYLNKYFFQDSVKHVIENKNYGSSGSLAGKKVMLEYTDPNPFKPLHIGHLMTNAIGESIARILEFSGAEVWRANYQGDIGLHVAKAIWGLLENKNLQDKSGSHNLQAENIGRAYALGATAYEEDEKAKKEIDAINQKIYDKGDEKINTLYDWGFEVTMKAFEDIYDLLGTQFDYYFLESQMAPIGINTVKKNLGKIFEESDGAVVFRAEKHNEKLHTRVFITKAGLPTYETKELGLAMEKFKTKPDLDLSIIITANEQAEYMRVVTKALSLIQPEYASKMSHITHGMMRFTDGKISSRKGNLLTGEMLIKEVKGRARDNTDAAIAAIKYMILKQAIGGDIVFNIKQSVSTEGDSGPYLQYAHARARSVLEKASKDGVELGFANLPPEVILVEQMLYRFPEVVARAAEEYEPHHIASFLIELARAYNSFYADTVIVDKNDSISSYKVAVTLAFAEIMQKGLRLLGIPAPERV